MPHAPARQRRCWSDEATLADLLLRRARQQREPPLLNAPLARDVEVHDVTLVVLHLVRLLLPKKRGRGGGSASQLKKEARRRARRCSLAKWERRRAPLLELRGAAAQLKVSVNRPSHVEWPWGMNRRRCERGCGGRGSIAPLPQQSTPAHPPTSKQQRQSPPGPPSAAATGYSSLRRRGDA